MDESLRRALRDGHPERTRSLRERAGDDPFATGPVTLPAVDAPLALALAEGGGALATVDPLGTLRLWDVASARVSAQHAGVHPRSLALRDDGWVAWVDDRGLHGGWRQSVARACSTSRASRSAPSAPTRAGWGPSPRAAWSSRSSVPQARPTGAR